MDFPALWLTLRLAIATTLLLLLVAVPLAWWIARGDGVGRGVVQTVVALPLVLPPTVLGFYLLVLLGPMTGPGRLLIRLVGHPLAFSFGGLLLGSMLYSLPFAVQPLVAGFRGMDREVVEAAEGLGAAPGRVFRQVVLPTVRGSLVASAVLCFTHTVGEFGVVLMLGGNIPGVTRTLSISLYDMVEDGRYGAANVTAAVLVGVAMVGLLAIYVAPGARRRLMGEGSGVLG